MKFRNFLPGFLALSILWVATLACNFPQQDETVQETIPVTTEAVDSLREDLEKVQQDIQNSGQATLVVDEAELTSLVAFELQSQENPPLRDPQVHLQDGQIVLNGNVQQGETNAPVEMVFTVAPDAEGKPDYEIVSAKVGPLPLPESMLAQFSQELDDVFTSTIDSRMEGLYIDSIQIADGAMTIQGHTR
jgi:uncharacterized protein YpmS